MLTLLGFESALIPIQTLDRQGVSSYFNASWALKSGFREITKLYDATSSKIRGRAGTESSTWTLQIQRTIKALGFEVGMWEVCVHTSIAGFCCSEIKGIIALQLCRQIVANSAR